MRARLVTALTAAAAALVPATLVLGAAPAVAAPNPGGNNGTVKIAEADADETTANDPHVACTFKIRWFNFDQGANIISSVSFASQAPTAAAKITVTGKSFVNVGGDPAGGGTDLDGEEQYTLAFSGAAPQANQGYHVKVTVATPGSKGNDTKSKVFWVQPCATPETPGTPETPEVPETPQTPETPEVPETPQTPETPEVPQTPTTPFDWNWQYPNPTCDALSLTYPANIPAGQANDANVRFATAQGQFTLNFHNNEGTWSGTHVFDFTSHPQWPAGLTTYHVVWVQVGGTNYHWQGDVSCAPVPTTDPEAPFTWDWEYADPTCTALTVGYPANIPSGQANDANIRFESNVGQFTLNFHDNEGTWSGTHVFDYRSHPQWPAGVTDFHVVWTQVGGTNYHWQGDVACVIEDGTAKAVTDVAGFRTGTMTVSRGARISGNSVAVAGTGFQPLVLQMSSAGKSSWKVVSSVTPSAGGTAKVTFPKLTKKGTYRFRVAVAGSGISTGDTTGVLTVRVR